MEKFESIEEKIQNGEDKIVKVKSKILFFTRYNYVYEPTRKKLKKYEMFVSQSDAQKMIACMNNNDFSAVKNIKKTMGTGFLIEGRGTDNGDVFLVQVFKYVPHDFVAASPVAVLHEENAKFIFEFFKS